MLIQICQAQSGITITEKIERLLAFCDSTGADEVLISKKGKPVVHWVRTDFSRLEIDSTMAEHCGSPYMYTASMVKSWTGLMIGILIDKGILDHADVPVCNYIPEWQAGCDNQITIRHLLTMTSGINKRPAANSVLSASNMNEYVVKIQPDNLPDTRFDYSNESVQLLGIIVERATGKPADEAFQEYLFEPLGIDSTSFSKDSFGNVVVYGGCTTTVNNAHTIGLLMLNKGIHKDRRIISEQWINESTSPGPMAGYYGFLWWLDNVSKYKNFAATGDLGQMTIVFPELELVFVRKQSCDLSLASRRMSWMGPQFLELISQVGE